MQTLETLVPGATYCIVQRGNADDPLVFEASNRPYLKMLIRRHLKEVCDILEIDISDTSLTLMLRFKDQEKIPAKYRNRLHQPLSNLFNSYAKSINKRYHRTGSLFRVRFERTRIA